MELHIEEVVGKKELIKFIKFPMRLYKGNEYYVPPLIHFELSTLLPNKNPAFDHAEAKYWTVTKNKEIVGRIAAIVLENELKEKQLARFGWIDFIDDLNVSSLLLDTAKKWALSKGATAIHGPMGFTDLDFEGALTSGYDQLATQATIYNHPYYIDHYKKWGLSESASWVEIRTPVPKKIPTRVQRASSVTYDRYRIRIDSAKKKKEVYKYANTGFDIMNEAYSNLYGYQKLTDKQVKYYLDLYLGLGRKDFIVGVVNKDEELIGFAITLPSISKGLQKANGRLFPIGFIFLLFDLLFSKEVDFFLIAVKPEYQKKGVSALIFNKLNSVYIKKRMKYVYSGPILETNNKMLNTWRSYSADPIKIKRSCFRKNF